VEHGKTTCPGHWGMAWLPCPQRPGWARQQDSEL